MQTDGSEIGLDDVYSCAELVGSSVSVGGNDIAGTRAGNIKSQLGELLLDRSSAKTIKGLVGFTSLVCRCSPKLREPFPRTDWQLRLQPSMLPV